MRIFLVLLAVGIGIACGVEKAKVQKNFKADFNPSIIGGKKLKDNDTLSTFVVAVYDEREEFLCTGTLIKENIVVTAAHCITSKPNQLKVIFGVDAMMTLNARELDIREQNIRKVTATKIHEKYETDFEKQPELDQSDLALVKFAGSLPPGFQPVALLKEDAALNKGVQATIAGYGVRKVDLNPVDVKNQSKEKIIEKIDSGEITCDETLKECFTVDMTGDGELYAAVANVKGFTVSEVRLDESKGQGTCNGDSGGPAFILHKGSYQLFGVTSRGNMLCDFEGVYTNLLEYSDWIEKSTKELELK